MNPRDPSGGAYVDPAQWELGAQVETHPLVIAAIARAVAAEREACAALCEAYAARAGGRARADATSAERAIVAWTHAALALGAAIRARGGRCPLTPSPPRSAPMPADARLRQAREAAGLTVGQAARILGIAHGCVRDDEVDVAYVTPGPTDADLAAYAATYGVSVRHLRHGTPPATDADGRRAFGARWDALSPQGRADALRCLDLMRAAE